MTDGHPGDAPVWAITGVPGSGKTTLATALAAETGRTLISIRDLVAEVDPDTFEEGRMADATRLADAFVRTMEGRVLDGPPVILDGWPRTREQALLLPQGSLVFLLRCQRAEAIMRQVRRARIDDSPYLAAKRYDEQSALLEGWAEELAGWSRTINTTYRDAAYLQRTFMWYLRGERREVF